ncbi:hypothetical protein CYMTET_31170, partial [Cymbomonas tetramitiformis]
VDCGTGNIQLYGHDAAVAIGTRSVRLAIAHPSAGYGGIVIDNRTYASTTSTRQIHHHRVLGDRFSGGGWIPRFCLGLHICSGFWVWWCA